MTEQEDPLAAAQGCLTALRYAALFWAVVSMAVLAGFGFVVLMGWV